LNTDKISLNRGLEGQNPSARTVIPPHFQLTKKTCCFTLHKKYFEVTVIRLNFGNWIAIGASCSTFGVDCRSYVGENDKYSTGWFSSAVVGDIFSVIVKENNIYVFQNRELKFTDTNPNLPLYPTVPLG
jgi:hypothetical protein